MKDKIVLGVSKLVGIWVSVIVAFFVVSVISGTIIWLAWPVAIPAVFPGLVKDGVLAGHLNWWVSVLFSWIVAFLFKSNNSSKKEKK